MTDRAVMLSDERIEAMRVTGLWPDKLMLDFLDQWVASQPDRTVITDRNSITQETTRLTYAELDDRSRRIAVGLAKAGIEKDDVVAWQLPNWWQFAAMHMACLRIGAVSNPLMPIFRERELEFMLGFAEAKAIVVPRTFRRFDHPAMARALQAQLPMLDHVWVVGDDFETALLDNPADDGGLFAQRRPGPNDVIELLYTSGTTGQPKGVMHTSNTMISNLQTTAREIGLDRDTVILMSSPLAHQTGFLYGQLMPIVLGGRVVFQDVWDPAEAAMLIEREGVTFTMGATPFLADLTNTPALAHHDISSLETFISGGAPIPRVLVQRATENLKCSVHAIWGMSENGIVTVTRRGDAPEKIFDTDGAAMPGFEVRVIDENGKPVPPDTEGDLQVRGMGQFVGYAKRPEAWGTDPEGWFDTGDRARMDADGYIRIVGRSKDIIIRGGENVPVTEVEELLYRHPAVADAAVVAMPDERLGERGCAVVTLKPGNGMAFDEMANYLAEQQMARQYMPEQLVVIDEMPRTASGKIQKYKLRDMVQDQKPARG
ncbi:MAG: AMP-binding protein [Alphaproteobacteria bacterium]